MAGRHAGTLVAGNHVSWLDIPVLLSLEPMRVVAKRDIAAWPLVGMMAARAGAIFIDRRSPHQLPATVAQIADALWRGQSVLVFPGGTTRCGRRLGRFFRASFQAAVDAGAAVRPVSVSYVLADGSPTTAAAFLGDESLLASVRRVIATAGLCVVVDVAAARDPYGETRKSLAATAAAAVETAPSTAPVTVAAPRARVRWQLSGETGCVGTDAQDSVSFVGVEIRFTKGRSAALVVRGGAAGHRPVRMVAWRTGRHPLAARL